MSFISLYVLRVVIISIFLLFTHGRIVLHTILSYTHADMP